MTNWLEENVTDLTDSKLLKEHGIEMEPDATWEIINKDRYDARKVILLRGVVLPGDAKYKKGIDRKIHTIEHTPAYRLDKLKAKLPEWCFELEFFQLRGFLKRFKLSDEACDRLAPKISHSVMALQKSRGQQAIKACVQLLVLLKAERSKDEKELPLGGVE